jgi:hypothetical protein
MGAAYLIESDSRNSLTIPSPIPPAPAGAAFPFGPNRCLTWAASPGRDYNLRVKTVGSRRVDSHPLDDQGRLSRTAAALSPGGSAPSGVYRFDSFEEADRWMLEMMRRSRARRNRKTSPASPVR